MKALHLLKTSVGATWALRQVRELVNLGVNVHVALPDGPLVHAYEQVGATVHLGQYSLPMASPHSWPGLFREFRDLVNEISPDVIHSHFVGTTLTMRMALWKKHQTPRVFQVPGPLHLEHLIYRRAELAIAGPSDYWMGSCVWTCDRYRESGVDDSRIFLAYYGSDLESFVRKPAGKLRAELGLSSETKVIGMVAYMYAPKRYLGQRRGLKGHEDLIDALGLCFQRDPNLVAVFVGAAWNGATSYEEQVKEYARQRVGDRAIFLGTRSDVSEIYPDFDVVVHPSHSENVGGAAESLILGVPTIATDVGGFPDLIKPGGTGWLVPPKDPEALASAIGDALADPVRAQQMADEGALLARQLMDVRNNARDVLNAYERMNELRSAQL